MLEKLQDCFHWPGMVSKVRHFCQQCLQFKSTTLCIPTPAPLISLPIIGKPFEWVGMDIVGLLPKSAHSHEYILVIMDYLTRYPEAIPLWKATSPNIARELVLLFSQVGILKDILTDQGTLFMAPASATSPHLSVSYPNQRASRALQSDAETNGLPSHRH